VNAFPRVLGTLLYNNDTFTCQASYQIVSVNTGASRTWSLGNANPLTTAANGTFTLDAIDYTQKLASGRFVLRLQETTGGVSGSTININGSFRVALTP
jgi:phosphoribosylformylglycinamidine (FGAM) synthase-like amidotransferase family enzyme